MTEVTGAQVEVEVVVDNDPAQMWDLVTDVARIGEWSPECVGGTWLDGASARPGARFEGRNAFANGFRSTAQCVVTQAVPASVFEWVVLDPSGRLDRPGSTWRYELVPVGARGQTRVRHRFVHGPGDTGLRRGMEGSPDEAAAVLAERLATLGANMTATIERMAGS